MTRGRPGGHEELPTTFVPRWLAAVVLTALLASGALTAWLVLAPASEGPPGAPSTATSRSEVGAGE